MKTEQYIISGMSCAACSASVERVIKRLEGVKTRIRLGSLEENVINEEFLINLSFR